MITEFEVRQNVRALLSNAISLDAFEAWLMEHSWNMHRDSSPAAQELVSEILLDLAEYSNGDVTDLDLRRMLSSAINQVFVGVRLNPDQSISLYQPVRTANSVATLVRSFAA